MSDGLTGSPQALGYGGAADRWQGWVRSPLSAIVPMRCRPSDVALLAVIVPATSCSSSARGRPRRLALARGERMSLIVVGAAHSRRAVTIPVRTGRSPER